MEHVCLAFSSSSVHVQSGLSELGTAAGPHRERGAIQRGKAGQLLHCPPFLMKGVSCIALLPVHFVQLY